MCSKEEQIAQEHSQKHRMRMDFTYICMYACLIFRHCRLVRTAIYSVILIYWAQPHKIVLLLALGGAIYM